MFIRAECVEVRHRLGAFYHADVDLPVANNHEKGMLDRVVMFYCSLLTQAHRPRTAHLTDDENDGSLVTDGGVQRCVRTDGDDVDAQHHG